MAPQFIISFFQWFILSWTQVLYFLRGSPPHGCKLAAVAPPLSFCTPKFRDRKEVLTCFLFLVKKHFQDVFPYSLPQCKISFHILLAGHWPGWVGGRITDSLDQLKSHPQRLGVEPAFHEILKHHKEEPCSPVLFERKKEANLLEKQPKLHATLSCKNSSGIQRVHIQRHCPLRYFWTCMPWLLIAGEEDNYSRMTSGHERVFGLGRSRRDKLIKK